MARTHAPAETDVCIIGAGPHGLAAAYHLWSAAPNLRVTVVDERGRWLTTWRAAFARAQITTLRSPIVHHPSHDPSGLARFLHDAGLPSSGLDYEQPTTQAFDVFCDALIAQAGLPDPLPLRLGDIRNDGRRLRLETDAGPLSANHVIIAANPHRRVVPDWTWPLLGRRVGLVEHGLDIDLPSMERLDGKQIAIVGGGLTAAHLAVGATALGAHVHLLTRHPLRVRSFDTSPGWLGPKCLNDFHAEPDAAMRLRMAEAAREGGSIPQLMRNNIDALAEAGSITVHESSTVDTADIDALERCVLELTSEARLEVDRIWLATGTQCDVGALRSARWLVEDAPVLDGYPLVDQNLRLGPHPAYVMGRMSTTAFGPAAGNLWGAQRAAHRITELITGVDLQGASIATIPVSGGDH